MNGSVPNGELGITIIADLSPGIPDEPEILLEEPDNAQYGTNTISQVIELN